MEGQDRHTLPTINTAPFEPDNFFRAIATDPEEAFGQIQAQVPTQGPATPRAQALIDAGEWDAGDKVALVCLLDDRCPGIIGGTQSLESQLSARFCGRKKKDCSFFSHTSLKWKEFRAGWFIPAGNSAKTGFYQEPRLPLRAQSGPIDAATGRALGDPAAPFKLTVGQWKFVIESWWDSKVIALSDDARLSDTPASESAAFETPTAGQLADHEAAGVDLPGTQSEDELESLSSSDEGTASGEASRTEDMDVFVSSVEEIKETVADLQATILQLNIDLEDVREELTTERQEHARTRSAVNRIKGHVRGGMASASQGQRSDPRIQEVVGRVRALETQAAQGGLPSGSQDYRPDPRIQDMAGRVSTLESQAAQVSSSIRAISGATTQLEDTLSDPTGTLQVLIETVEQLEKQVNVGGGVEAHGARFTNPSEIPGWLQTTPNALALFHDAVTVLHCIGAPSVTHKATLTMMKAQRDVRITSDLEAKVVTSFKTKLPAILYGSVSTSDDEYVELGSKLKKYQDWHADDGVSGVAQKITAVSGVHEVRKRVGQMAKHSTSVAAVLRLSDGLMSDSIHFVQRLVLFIDTWVLDLRDGTFFSEDQVWEIMVATIETIFDELRAARAPMQDVADDDRCMLLWGILKAHEVMRRFLKHEFINDPAISGILIQKMIRQSPAATSGSRLASLEKNVNSTMSKFVSLTTRVTTLEGKK